MYRFQSSNGSIPSATPSGADHADTNEQFDLFSTLTAPDPESNAGKFEAFHQANPHVYATIVEKAREWRTAGNGKLGMSLLFGMVRWVLALETAGDPFRLNDHYLPYYSRLVMLQEPDLAGLFDVRAAAEADAWLAVIKRYGMAA